MSERKKVGAAAVVFSVLLCVSAILFGVVAGAIAAIRFTISPKMMKKYIEDVDIGEIVLGEHQETVQTVSDFVYENIPPEVRESLQLALSQTQKLIEESYVKEFAQSKVEDFVNDLYYETGEGKITPEEVVECVRRCDREIYSLTGCRVSEKDLSIIQESLEESGVLKNISVDLIRQKTPGLSLFFKVISYKTAAIFAGISLFLLLLAALLNRFRIPSLFYVGASFFCIGGVFAVLSFLVDEFSEILREYVYFEISLISMPVAVLYKAFLFGGIGILAVGTACIAAAIVFLAVQKNNRKKPEIF